MLQSIGIGIQTLPKLLASGGVYVDKTEAAYRFVTGYKCVFISRPRRFGKSLMVSTLNEIFSGNKELFKGLWIYDKLDWAQYDYPVLRFDLSMRETSKIPLYDSIEGQLNLAAEQYNIQLTSVGIGMMLMELIRKTAAQSRTKKVVVLIDEYDSPITHYHDKPEQKEAHADVLRGFYGILKGMDPYLRQVFITGITRYTRLGLFSALNNVTDLTLHEDYATAFGYTQTEIEANFAPHIDLMAARLKLQRDELLGHIRHWYNGYSWDGQTRVYNPFGFANFLIIKEFQSYWTMTGSTRLLQPAFREQALVIDDLEGYDTDGSILDSIDYSADGGIPLLFQTGYLTIKEKYRDGIQTQYILHIPNEEVRRALNTEALVTFFEDGNQPTKARQLTDALRRALDTGDVEEIIDIIKIFIAALPYQIIHRREAYWHSVVQTVLYCSGRRTYSEVPSSDGRADTITETPRFVYLFEYKTNGAATDAIAQIREKGYAERYRKSGKTVIGVGIVFDKASRSITDWTSETLVTISE